MRLKNIHTLMTNSIQLPVVSCNFTSIYTIVYTGDKREIGRDICSSNNALVDALIFYLFMISELRQPCIEAAGSRGAEQR